MTAASPSSAPQLAGGAAPAHQVSILLYSDDLSTRDTVRAAVGRRPARDVEVTTWKECATPAAATEAVEAGGWDLLILDGETSPIGGMGLNRQLQAEVTDCPPAIILTGRVQDNWLATWSLAAEAVPMPIDPVTLADAVARVARGEIA
ncbi:response regulator transcription factor [Kribbia dieselivorans]|uniref:response regulator transcription factor n=1 Tax=Kribbia dieselivorans TaxID=331526 RepID=UPI000837F7D1|nr:response regulator transcription factor [Kribbia dieselivorans]